MNNLLLIGASNFLAQEIIKSSPKSLSIVGVCIEENTDRHREFLAMEKTNLSKEILDITKNEMHWLNKLIG